MTTQRSPFFTHRFPAARRRLFCRVTTGQQLEDIGVDLSPDTADVSEQRGLLVEAVLLEADGQGHQTDRVLWCVAIPTADRSAILTRRVVAGWRSASAYAAELDKLAAVVSWGS